MPRSPCGVDDAHSPAEAAARAEDNGNTESITVPMAMLEEA
ncbi:hypothetical protein [Spiractinospora alimapuensis]|nr:hypothetical protein [Spiractinospora alimapuensis]